MSSLTTRCDSPTRVRWAVSEPTIRAVSSSSRVLKTFTVDATAWLKRWRRPTKSSGVWRLGEKIKGISRSAPGGVVDSGPTVVALRPAWRGVPLPAEGDRTLLGGDLPPDPDGVASSGCTL